MARYFSTSISRPGMGSSGSGGLMNMLRAKQTQMSGYRTAEPRQFFTSYSAPTEKKKSDLDKTIGASERSQQRSIAAGAASQARDVAGRSRLQSEGAAQRLRQMAADVAGRSRLQSEGAAQRLTSQKVGIEGSSRIQKEGFQGRSKLQAQAASENEQRKSSDRKAALEAFMRFRGGG